MFVVNIRQEAVGTVCASTFRYSCLRRVCAQVAQRQRATFVSSRGFLPPEGVRVYVRRLKNGGASEETRHVSARRSSWLVRPFSRGMNDCGLIHG